MCVVHRLGATYAFQKRKGLEGRITSYPSLSAHILTTALLPHQTILHTYPSEGTVIASFMHEDHRIDL